jgi:chromosome segregation ATPase
MRDAASHAPRLLLLTPQDHNSKLVKRVEGMEADMSAADNKRDAQSAAELRIAQLAHQHAKEALEKQRKASEEVHSEVQQLRGQLAALQDSAAGEAAELRKQLAAAQDKAVADVAALQRQLAEAQRSGSSAAEKEQQLQEQVRWPGCAAAQPGRGRH